MKAIYHNYGSIVLLAVSAIIFAGSVLISCSENETVQHEKIMQAAQPEACARCHAQAYQHWKYSHHALALRLPTDSNFRKLPDTVHLADGRRYIFFKKDAAYFLKTNDTPTNENVFKIDYIIGVEPLVQYVVHFTKGKKQNLTLAYDVKKKSYFDLAYDSLAKVGDWLHWTGQSMNWNSACADCHSTLVKKNYHYPTDSFSTTLRHISISCENCHGYVTTLPADATECTLIPVRRRSVKTHEAKIQMCAPCHSRRIQLRDQSDQDIQLAAVYAYEPLAVPTLHADGQINDEVFEYHSFTQSKMYAMGVVCTDCHEPHSGKLLAVGNALCTRCHTAATYDVAAHHFHPAQSKGAACVHCHMPGKYYMKRHYRHDHSLRIPRPDLSIKLGTPNACTQCHQDQTDLWAYEQLRLRNKLPKAKHFSDLIPKGDVSNEALEEIIRFVSDTTHAAVIRGFMMQYIPEQLLLPRMSHLQEDRQPYVRMALLHWSPKTEALLPYLQYALTDPNEGVRLLATKYAIALGTIATLPPETEYRYRNFLEYNAHSAGTLVDLATYYYKKNRITDALFYLRRALAVDSEYPEAYINLLILLSECNRTDEALHYALQACEIFPKDARFYYYTGLLYSEKNAYTEAFTYIQKAASLDPNVAKYAYNAGVIALALGNKKMASYYIEKAVKLEPSHPRYQEALVYLKATKP